MRRVLPLVVAALALALPATGGAWPAAEPAADEVFEKEVQAAGQAWQFGGVDLPKGYEAVVTATGSWEINSTWDKKVGPAGHDQYRAAGTYVKPGAAEGCLLVRTGDKVVAFAKDDEAVRITTPGKIYFCANDEPTEDGLDRAKDFIGGIPIKPIRESGGGSGFTDNAGTIKVRIAVRKSEK